MQQNEDQKWEDNRFTLRQEISKEYYTTKLREMLNKGEKRLPIDLNRLRNSHPELVNDILKFPKKAYRILKEESEEIVRGIQQDDYQGDKKGIQSVQSISIAFVGDFGQNLITPRGLTTRLSNQLVGVQGIVTRMTKVKSKILKSCHYEETNQQGSIKEYENNYDLASISNLNSTRSIPTKDKDGNPLIMEDGPSQFVDTQLFNLQELPETAPPGLLPRTIEVVLEDDLIDVVKPGDRVQITGVFTNIATGKTINQGAFKTILIATNAQSLTSEIDQTNITAQDIKDIKEQAKKADVLDKMIRSVAPSIFGHDSIKQGILLQLVGGVEKNPKGFHLRGDINIMMIGDPSTAKSQMLRYVMNTAPLAINTTGRGSSGVGLTAVVKIDRDSGQRSLEAGAMVLADRGIVCIDELDKMDQTDRVAIHEAMEQQTVTISKAGIHCSLNARCSVIAAANPIYGEYHTDLPPTKNINLPDSLLSRFDLLFIVLDEKNQQKDRQVAERVTKNHSYRSQKAGATQQVIRENMDLEDQDHVIQPNVQEDTSNISKGIFQTTNLYAKKKNQVFTQDFMQKYIKYAKKNVQPQITEETINYISKKWKNLRQKDLENEEVKVLPITVRTLESLIRLSTAHAKLRLSKEIQTQDCKNAYKLMKNALFGNDDEDSDDDDEDDNNDLEEEYTIQQKKKQTTKKQSQSNKKQGFQPYNKDNSNKMDLEENNKKSAKQSQQQTQKTTRSSQQTQKQQQNNNNKNELKSVQKSMHKMKIDDDVDKDTKDVEDLLAKNDIASIQVTKQEKIQVFKAIGNLLNNTGKDSATTNEIWTKVQNIFGSSHKNTLIKCLFDLDVDGKIDYSQDEDTIYLL